MTAMTKGIFFACLAALLYAINAPFSKILLEHMSPTITAGLLYIGAGLGMGIVALLRKRKREDIEKEAFSKSDIIPIIMMIALDIAAPVLLLFGLNETTASNASLLNNFEIVATALIALVFFGEKISSRLWVGIIFVTASCTLLSFDGLQNFNLSIGSLFILLASVCWGLENNCTRKLSSKDPLKIVLLKGIFSGLGSLIIGLSIGEKLSRVEYILGALLVGFVAYGLSIFFYVHAQRLVGAARTSAYYAIAPFLGAALSLAIFNDALHYTYFVAFILMIIGGVLCAKDEPIFKKKKINSKG